MKNRDLMILTVGLCLLICVFHLASAWAGHSLFRDQHLGTAIEYAKGEIDLLRPVIVGFNATNTPTTMEIPIWQALAALAFKTFGFWYGWANLVSLMLFFSGLWPLFQVVRAHVSARVAWWALALYLAQPIVVTQAGRAGTDGMCVALTLWFVYFADRLLRTGKWPWTIPATVFGALAALSKAPFFMAVGLLSFLCLLAFHRSSTQRWILLAATGVFSAFCLTVWTRHTDAQSLAAEFPLVDLRLSRKDNPGLWFSFFGSWAFNTDPRNWARAGWRGLNALFGSFALVALPIWGLFLKNRLGQLWLSAAVTTTFVFCHAVLWHQNYFLIYSPCVAILGAVALQRLEVLCALRPKGQTVLTSVTAGVLVLAAVQGVIGMETVSYYDTYDKKITEIIQKHTGPEDKLLIQGGGWGGQYLIVSDRRGLSIWGTQFLEDQRNLNRLRELGYNRLVMISESPLMTALQQTNPGAADYKRSTYHAVLTPVAQKWEALFESEDILIKKIP